MSAVPAVKLCGQCRHLLPEHRCAKSRRPIDFITGESRGYFLAQAERETWNGCGHDGKYWEPKEETT